MSSGMPVFVKIDDYKDVLDVIGLLKLKIKEAKEIHDKINTLKNEEDVELEIWRNNLEEVERKLHYIDTTLFEPNNSI